MILTFARDGMQKVNTTKSSCDDGVDGLTSAFKTNLGVLSAVREDIPFTHFNESKLTVVAVRIIICTRNCQHVCNSFEFAVQIKIEHFRIS